jgi:hypothetical protein
MSTALSKTESNKWRIEDEMQEFINGYYCSSIEKSTEIFPALYTTNLFVFWPVIAQKY